VRKFGVNTVVVKLDMIKKKFVGLLFSLVTVCHRVYLCQVHVCLFYNIANNRNPTVLTVNIILVIKYYDGTN